MRTVRVKCLGLERSAVPAERHCRVAAAGNDDDDRRSSYRRFPFPVIFSPKHAHQGYSDASFSSSPPGFPLFLSNKKHPMWPARWLTWIVTSRLPRQQQWSLTKLWGFCPWPIHMRGQTDERMQEVSRDPRSKWDLHARSVSNITKDSSVDTAGFLDVISMCLICDLSLPRLLSLEGTSLDCRWASRAVWRDQTEQRQPLRLCTYRSVLWPPVMPVQLCLSHWCGCYLHA